MVEIAEKILEAGNPDEEVCGWRCFWWLCEWFEIFESWMKIYFKKFIYHPPLCETWSKALSHSLFFIVFFLPFWTSVLVSEEFSGGFFFFIYDCFFFFLAIRILRKEADDDISNTTIGCLFCLLLGLLKINFWPYQADSTAAQRVSVFG